METEGLVKRSFVLAIGLFIMAFGVALSIKANLGTSPISSVPFVYSLGFPISMGLITIIMHVVFILLQILVLGKEYQVVQLLQLPIALIFGFFTDFTLALISARSYVHSYPLQWVLCLLSTLIIAFGVFLEVKSRVTYLAGEGLSLAIAKRFNLEFGKVKVGFDCTLVLMAIISSLVFLRRVQGVREGTIASALLVGTFVRLFNKKFTVVDAWLRPKDKGTETQVKVEDQGRLVITIGREYGSGGHEIGKQLAKELGISFYDSELINLSAKESGFTPEYIKENEQKLSSALLFDLYEQNYAYLNDEKPPLDVLFMVQSKVIRDIAQRESCVIVGRCAEFVLKGDEHRFSVFIHGNKKWRMDRCIAEYGIQEKDAEKEIEKKDSERRHYCQHYTGAQWGASKNYHLHLDSSLFGVEQSVKLIKQAVQLTFQGLVF